VLHNELLSKIQNFYYNQLARNVVYEQLKTSKKGKN